MPSTENYITQAAGDARYLAGSLGSSTPATVDAGDAGTAGVSSSAARADHEHPVSVTAAQLVPTAAWTTYSGTAPTPTAGAFTTVSGSGAYVQMGKTVHYRYTVTITTVGTGSGDVRFDLPPVAASTNHKSFGFGREDGVSGGIIVVYPFSSTRVTARAPVALASSQIFNVTGTYEAA